MATYRISAPDGSEWEINAPEGATEEAVMKYAQAQWKGGLKNKPAPEQKPDPTADMTTAEKILAGVGKAPVDIWRGLKQMTGNASQAEIDEARKLDAPLMDTAEGTVGNVLGNLTTAVIPGGATVKGSALIGGALAALQPTKAGESRLQNAAEGAAWGAGGAAVGKGIGWLRGKAGERINALAAKVADKAAADAAAETASARSLAGRTAQDAYRQLENLRELGGMKNLTPEQAKLAKELTEELAQKAQEKLIPSAAAKKEAAQAFKEAIETEAERAAQLAAERLSGKEAKAQVMARVKRYWPGAITGAAGMMIGGPPAALVSGAAGLAARPMFHATRRMLQNPAVQYQMLKPLAGQGGTFPRLLLDDLTDPRIMGLLGPSIYAAQE